MSQGQRHGRNSKPRWARRGFTLTELMAVVMIMGILAAIGASMFRHQMARAKSAEPRAVLGAIAAAQESWRAEHMVYLAPSTSMTSYYPPGTPNPQEQFRFKGWEGDDEQKAWKRLNALPKGIEYVNFGYACVAGLPSPTAGKSVLPALPGTLQLDFTPDQPWYVAQAVGDVDNDGTTMYATLTSVNNLVHIENDGE